MTIAIIDFDLIAHKAASGAETRITVSTHKETGEQSMWENKTEFIESLEKADSPDNYDLTLNQNTESFEVACNNAEKLINEWMTAVGANNYKLYIGMGDETFRHKMELPYKYKDRSGVKSVFVDQLKYWALENHPSELVLDLEADDWLSIEAYKGCQEGAEKAVAVTEDKDARGCKGWLYQPHRKSEGVILISGLGELRMKVKDGKKKLEGEGNIWLMAQWIMGDATDTINPSKLCGKRFGQTNAYSVLKDCKTFPEAFERAVEVYYDWYGQHNDGIVEYTSWTGKEIRESWIDYAQKYLDLVRMRRWVGDEVLVRDLIEKHCPEYLDVK